MGQKIEGENLVIIENLIKNYMTCHSEIKSLEEQMDELENKMKHKISELQNLRETELQIISKLESDYGPGKLETQKLEWIKK